LKTIHIEYVSAARYGSWLGAWRLKTPTVRCLKSDSDKAAPGHNGALDSVETLLESRYLKKEDDQQIASQGSSVRPRTQSQGQH
jgi:hypothetical protein